MGSYRVRVEGAAGDRRASGEIGLTGTVGVIGGTVVVRGGVVGGSWALTCLEVTPSDGEQIRPSAGALAIVLPLMTVTSS